MHTVMPPRWIPVTLGIVAIVCAVLGLVYNAATLFFALQGAFEQVIHDFEAEHFYPVFYAMSAICVLSYAVLLWCGVQFLRSPAPPARTFTALLVFELLYFWSPGVLSQLPSVGLSIGAATGVANGGLVVQGAILLPIWGPPVALWLARRARGSAVAA